MHMQELMVNLYSKSHMSCWYCYKWMKHAVPELKKWNDLWMLWSLKVASKDTEHMYSCFTETMSILCHSEHVEKVFVF